MRKGLKMKATPEILADEDLVESAFHHAWNAFCRAGYKDCQDRKGNLNIEIYIGEEEKIVDVAVK